MSLIILYLLFSVSTVACICPTGTLQIQYMSGEVFDQLDSILLAVFIARNLDRSLLMPKLASGRAELLPGCEGFSDCQVPVNFLFEPESLKILADYCVAEDLQSSADNHNLDAEKLPGLWRDMVMHETKAGNIFMRPWIYSWIYGHAVALLYAWACQRLCISASTGPERLPTSGRVQLKAKYETCLLGSLASVAVISDTKSTGHKALNFALQHGLVPIDVDRKLMNNWDIGTKIIRDVISWALQGRANLLISSKDDAMTTWVMLKRDKHALPYVDASVQPAVVQHMAHALRIPEVMQAIGPRKLTICFWGYLTSSPWGGGAHFLLALSRAFERMGHRVYNIDQQKKGSEVPGATRFDLHVVVHSLQQLPMDLADSLLPLKAAGSMNTAPAKLLLRTDGPQILSRGTPRPEEDVELFKFAHRFATSATVFQSQWSLEATLKHGHQLINPVVIGNAPDPAVYHRIGKRHSSLHQGQQRIRLCMSVWSDSQRKNWDLIAFLDRELDHSRYTLILIGRLPENFVLRQAHHIPPVKQEELGHIMRTMDIFIAPSWNECFSNAEAQALASGLPVLALNNSSHPEVIGNAGRLFSDTSDVLQELEALVANYEFYAASAWAQDIDVTAMKYLAAAGL